MRSSRPRSREQQPLGDRRDDGVGASAAGHLDALHRPAAAARLGCDLAAERALADAAGPAQHDAAGPLGARHAEPRGHLRQRQCAADERRPAGLQPDQAALVQGLGVPVRRDAQALLQRLTQMGVPAQRGGAVAGLELALHQRAVRALVGGLVLGQLLPLRAGAQQLDVARLQALARGFGPRFVARAGQQVAGVAQGGLGALRSVAPGQRRVGLVLEHVGVDDHLALRPQHHLAALRDERVVAPQRLARVVHRLAQVGRSGLGVELRPQRVDQLLARQPVPGLQAQQLHQMRRAQAGPLLGREFGGADAHREAAEQRHVQGNGRVGRRGDEREVHWPQCEAVGRRPQ